MTRQSGDRLLVILGAGASYDSFAGVVDAAWKPPLTTELFAQRPAFQQFIVKYPAVRPLAARCREGIAAERNLEEILDEVSSEAGQNPARTRQLMALRFYLAEVLGAVSRNWQADTSGVTNYVRLVDEIEHWRTCGEDRQVTYVTFNYDTLLEQALASIFGDWSADSFARYTSYSKFKLLKPHGSIQWSRRVPYVREQMYANAIIQGSPDLGLEHADLVFATATDSTLNLYPALALPLRSKLLFEWKQEQQETLNETLPLTTRVMVIGWQGMEKHFNALVRDKVAKTIQIMVVDKDETAGHKIIQHLRSEWNVWGWAQQIAVGGFSNLVAQKQISAFLGARLPAI